MAAQVDLKAFSMDQLSSLANDVRLEKQSRVKQIKDTYGNRFCNIVGVETIERIRFVAVQSVRLQHDAIYPQCTVTPSMLEEHSAVRGIMGSNRPFIAIKIDILDKTTKAKIDTVVELIFKRYVAEPDNYVTALNNKSDTGARYMSYLYSSGGMNDMQITAVQELLNGETIVALTDPNVLIKMA